MACNIQRGICQVLAAKQVSVSSLRLYSRWTHRTPNKVLLPFEPKGPVNLKKEKIIDLDPKILKKSQSNPTVQYNDKLNEEPSISKISTGEFKDKKTKREEKLKKHKFYLNQLKVFDDNGEIVYEKLKENDSRISALLVRLKSKKERTRTGLTLVEGWRMIVDGLVAKCSLKYVIFSQTEDLNNLRPFLPKTGVKFYKIPYKEISLWSDLETSPGIFGIFEIPSFQNVKRHLRPLPLHLVCDNIRDPGNLGAILRASAGAGCEKILLTKGCVDVWDPKVIRSAAGAHFRLPIRHSIEWDELPTLLEPDSSLFIADSNSKVLLDESFIDKDEEDFFNIPVLPYYGVEFSSLKHITLIIGGETEGISEKSYRLASSRNGLRLNIPLEKGVDSLNTGMATAVIAFEIKKQIIQGWIKKKSDKNISASV